MQHLLLAACVAVLAFAVVVTWRLRYSCTRAARALTVADLDGGEPRSDHRISRIFERSVLVEFYRALLPPPGVGTAAVQNPRRIVRAWRRANLAPALRGTIRDMAFASPLALGPAALITAAHAVTFAATTDVFCDDHFPFRLAGSVHARSRVALYAGTVTAADSSGGRCRLSDAWCSANVEAALDLTAGLRPHKRGVEVDVSVAVMSAADGQVLWTSTATFVFPLRPPPPHLAPASRDLESQDEVGDAGRAGSAPDLEPPTVAGADLLAAALAEGAEGGAVATPLPLSEAVAGIWSRASGDFNPIHLSHASAWAFGFAGRVAHGMSALHAALPNVVCAGPAGVELSPGIRVPAVETTAAVMQLAVTFARPLILPAQPQLLARSEGADKTAFALLVRQGAGKPAKPCLAGSIWVDPSWMAANALLDL